MSSNGEDYGVTIFWFDIVGVVGGSVTGEGVDVDESAEDVCIVEDDFCCHFLDLCVPLLLVIIEVLNYRLLMHV